MFPNHMGSEVGGKSFEEVFKTNPKIVEFCHQCWSKSETTGLFLEFLNFVEKKK